LWNKTYGGTLYEYAVSIVQTIDGGYALAGVTTAWLTGTSDFWLVKTDSSGNQLWNKTYGGTGDDYANYMIQTADGGYMLAGTADSFGAGGDDFWLVKTDATGNQVWNKTFGGNGDDFLNSVIRTADGGYALVGGTRIFGASIGDAWLIKIDASGKQLWNKTYGGPNNDEGTSLVQTSDGGYAFVGDTSSYGAGNDDFLMIRTDSLGNQLWNLTYGGISREWAYSISKTSDGGYALAGLTYSFGNGGSDFLLVKLAPETTIPEFTTWTFLSIFLASTLCIFAFKRKTSNHQQQMKRKT
jgi:hypothetical protein